MATVALTRLVMLPTTASLVKRTVLRTLQMLASVEPLERVMLDGWRTGMRQMLTSLEAMIIT